MIFQKRIGYAIFWIERICLTTILYFATCFFLFIWIVLSKTSVFFRKFIQFNSSLMATSNSSVPKHSKAAEPVGTDEFCLVIFE